MKTTRRPVVLEIRGLVVRHGPVTAVDRVDLEVPDGGLTALVGASGCGKTSLLRAVAGFEVPAAGSVRVGGEPVAAPDRWVAPERRQVGMVFQEGALFPHLTVWENVRYGVRGRDGGERRAREALELVGLEDLGDRFPDQLSGGQQRRVALARALAPSPRLVLLDEPFDGLDAGLRDRVRQEVREILLEAGTSAILVTHDQEEALSFAERVAVMHEGRILQIGSPEEIYHRPSCLEVARFIGGGELVSCDVDGGRLRSAFGVARCSAADGPGLLFLRPEDLRLSPVEGEGGGVNCALAEGAAIERPAPGRQDGDGGDPIGVRGTLVERRFFGHDVLDRVRLEGGRTLEVRVLSSTTFPVGCPVRLTLRPGHYRVFPAAA